MSTLTPVEALADSLLGDAEGRWCARLAIEADRADHRRVLCAHLATLRADLADAKANPERVQRAPFYLAQITILRGLGESLYPGAWVDTTDPEASR